MRKHLAGVVALCLIAAGAAGCNTSQTAALNAGIAAGRVAVAATPKLAAAANKVDAAIASGSAKLAAYCPLIRTALAVGSAFTTGKTGAVVSAANSVSAQFCGSTPTDIVSGAQLVEAAVSDLTTAGVISSPVKAAPMALARYHRWVALHRA